MPLPHMGRALYHARLQWFFILIIYPYKISASKWTFISWLWGESILETFKPEEICFLGFEYILFCKDLSLIVYRSFFLEKNIRMELIR